MRVKNFLQLSHKELKIEKNISNNEVKIMFLECTIIKIITSKMKRIFMKNVIKIILEFFFIKISLYNKKI